MSLLTAFPPVVSSGARLLILGSMPGVKSLQEDRYYAHPRNAFWPLMIDCLSVDGNDYEQCKLAVQEHGIALWDVLKHCERKGSLDANIRNDTAVCNDFCDFFITYPTIKTVLFNGKTSEKLFRQHVLEKMAGRQLPVPDLVGLPSTSPAMAMLSFEQKLVHWRAALDAAGVLDAQTT